MKTASANTSEFIGKIIDIFEDFLTEKRIAIDPTDRLNQAFDFENDAIIKSADYDMISSNLSAHLQNWNLLDSTNNLINSAGILSNSNVQQFIADTIEILESVLESRNIDIINSEKDDDDDASTIYGSDYGMIQTELEDLLLNHNLIKPSDIGL